MRFRGLWKQMISIRINYLGLHLYWLRECFDVLSTWMEECSANTAELNCTHCITHTCNTLLKDNNSLSWQQVVQFTLIFEMQLFDAKFCDLSCVLSSADRTTEQEPSNMCRLSLLFMPSLQYTNSMCKLFIFYSDSDGQCWRQISVLVKSAVAKCCNLC